MNSDPSPSPPKDSEVSTSHRSSSVPTVVPASTDAPTDVDSNDTEASPGALNTATAALANSISSAFAALGFNAPSDSDTSSRDSSPAPLSTSEQLDAQVDELSDETVTRYLQHRHSSTS
jgi:hypothetical protein